MKSIIAPPKVTAHTRARVNQGTNTGRCAHCLELSTFRVFKANGVNRLACVICLHSVRYVKYLSIHRHYGLVRDTKLNFKDKLRRLGLRIKVYFKGNHIHGPFGRRRKK